MRGHFAIGLGGAFLAGSLWAQDFGGDRETGRELAEQCRTCHGLEGQSQIPIAPSIGGEPAPYIARQLRAFRRGTREHEMMNVVASALSDQQIADLAAWYSGHTVKATLAADPADAPQACTGCHGMDGIAVVEDAPNLAGESTIYIGSQLKAFQRGKRTHETMSEVASGMTDEAIRAASEWYSAISLEVDLVE